MARTGPSQRQQRIEAQMQRALAELLDREVRDPRVGRVTVTGVEVAQDLSHARVFVVPFGGATANPELLEGLGKAAGFLRGEVGRQVGLRHAPRLEFLLDESFDRAARLNELISAAVKNQT